MKIRLASLLAACLLPLTAAASEMPPQLNNRYALVIGISHYSDSHIPSLRGVPLDMVSARQMANAMGIPDQNISYLRDDDATAEHIRQAIGGLNRQLHPGDRLFIYYSGHGTRWHEFGSAAGSCTEGLVATDGEVMSNHELGKLLEPLARKTDKMMVFYDACFSGGVAATPLKTRAITINNIVLTPKFAAEVASPSCYNPSNFKTRSLNTALQQEGGLPQNIVHIAASRPDEVSFDNSLRGGLATAAWRDCLLGEARDLSGSGAVTVSDITRCAQAKLDNNLAGQPGVLGQHMTLGGNSQFVPAWIKSAFVSPPPPPSPAQLAQAPDNSANQVSPPAPTPPAALQLTPPKPPVHSAPPVHLAQLTPPAALPPETPPPAVAPTAPATLAQHRHASPADMLQQIHAQRDGARQLKVVLQQNSLRIGHDKLQLSVSAEQDGYLYIALAGSDNKSLYLLYPNKLDQDNLLHAGETLKLPARNWQIDAGGPAGHDHLLVMLTDAPRQLEQLKAVPSGPFMQTLLDTQGRSLLQQVLSNSANQHDEACSGSLRNLQVSRRCSDAFASALLDVREIK